MSGRRLRSLFALVTVAVLVAKVVQVLRGGPTSSFSAPTPTAGPPSVPKVTLGAALAPTADPADIAPDDGADPPIVPGTLFDDEATVEAVVGGETTAGAAPTWVAPTVGACPDGYPVKAKVGSGIFHVPGMSAYERTTPDRCYPTAEAALADGLRAAKR